MTNTHTHQRSVSSLYNTASMQSHKRVVDLLMAHSFFLPVDVMKSPNWKVHNITVLSQDEFGEVWELIAKEIDDAGDIKAHFEAGYELCCFSKFIGISARRSLVTGQYHLVIKPWYGKNPYTKEELQLTKSTSEHITNLLSFLCISTTPIPF